MANAPAIVVENLTKIYRSHVKKEGLWNSLKSLIHREYRTHVAVDHVSFQIAQGELIGILGANGAGKTTLLKMLSGILYPTGGSAQVLGYIPWERSNEFKRRISLVMGQRNQLWWDLPAADSFLLNKEIYQIPDRDYHQRLTTLATMLDVAHKLHVQVRRLSLGERMKCELIGALLHNPRVLFLDEPTLGLDVVSQQTVRDFIKRYNRETGTTIILTSHYMEDIEQLCERVLVLEQGTIAFDGSLEQLIHSYVQEKIIRITFRTTVERSELVRYGIVEEWQPLQAVLRVPRSDVASITSQLLLEFPVIDLTVEEVPIESIIRKIFA